MSRAGEKNSVEFAALVRAFERLKHTNSQRTMIAMLAVLLRSSSDPDDMQHIYFVPL